MRLVTGITTKNEEWIIDKTLKVITKFSDVVIVYDDGSTDKTEEICKSYENVVWRVRPAHDPLLREEAKQRLELIGIISEYDPDYVLLLDADEIPTPNILKFLDNVEKDYPDTHIFRSRMINLYEDESKYRVDKYITKYGTSVDNDPFSDNAWFKHPFFKFEKNKDYKYDLSVQKGGCSRYHPAPENVSGTKKDTLFHIIHYGKIGAFYLSGEKIDFYSKIEEKWGKGKYEDRLEWHREHNRVHTLKTLPTDSNWFWGDDE